MTTTKTADTKASDTKSANAKTANATAPVAATPAPPTKSTPAVSAQLKAVEATLARHRAALDIHSQPNAPRLSHATLADMAGSIAELEGVLAMVRDVLDA
jgi:hypothetical protein